MARYITPTLTITSNAYSATNNPGPTTSPLAISVTDLLDVTAVESKIVTVSTTDAVLFTGADYAPTATAGTDGGFVFLKNHHATVKIHIGHNPAGDGEMEDGGAADEDRLMTLFPGEFAFFPWDVESNLHVDADAAGDSALEAIVFLRTGTA
tara:strand:+ start:648 stop:1103 length:456 start_codon:yes stop_codon:yes gene_type:complete